MALALRGARARPRSSAPDNQERPTREDCIRQEVHVLHVVRVQVSLNNISQKRTRARKGEETRRRSQGTEAPSASVVDVKMPTKDQAVTESNRKGRRNVRIYMCTRTHTYIDIRPFKKYCESTADETRQSPKCRTLIDVPLVSTERAREGDSWDETKKHDECVVNEWRE